MSLTDEPERPFWINPLDREKRPIDLALLRAAEELWPRASELVRKALRDEPRAPELLEEVVQRIAEAQRSGKLPSELQHAQPLLLTRFYQTLIDHIRHERRISYVGTVFDLEALYGASDPTRDVQALHRSILIAEVLALMDLESRRLTVLRLMGYKWSVIARLLGARTGTVRERLRVALSRLRDRLSRRRATDDEEHL